MNLASRKGPEELPLTIRVGWLFTSRWADDPKTLF